MIDAWCLGVWAEHGGRFPNRLLPFIGLGNELFALFHSIAHHFQHFQQHCLTVQLQGKALDPSCYPTEFIIISVAQLHPSPPTKMIWTISWKVFPNRVLYSSLSLSSRLTTNSWNHHQYVQPGLWSGQSDSVVVIVLILILSGETGTLSQESARSKAGAS